MNKQIEEQITKAKQNLSDAAKGKITIHIPEYGPPFELEIKGSLSYEEIGKIYFACGKLSRAFELKKLAEEFLPEPEPVMRKPIKDD